MVLQVSIPETLYNKYQLLHKTKSEDEVKALMKERLKRWLEVLVLVNPDDRSFIIGGDERRELERIFQTTVESARDLINKTRSLSSVQVGELQFNLTAGECSRLSDQAQFHGWPIEAFFMNTYRELTDRFMEKI